MASNSTTMINETVNESIFTTTICSDGTCLLDKMQVYKKSVVKDIDWKHCQPTGV